MTLKNLLGLPIGNNTYSCGRRRLHGGQRDKYWACDN